MKKVALIALAFVMIFTSCDVIDDPVIPFSIGYRSDLYGPAPEFGVAPTTTVNVLLEDFTAHQCGNCPDAGLIADAIYESNPDEVVLLAIHAGSLAVTNEEAPFDTDWTTPESEFYWEQLDFQANPLGRINRSGGPGNFYSPSTWEDNVNQVLGSTAAVNLQIEANYQSENNHLNVHVNGQFASNYDNGTHLVVLIAESELYDYQLWYGQDPSTVPDYHFKHILRGSVSGPSGLSFNTEAVSSGEEIQKDYTIDWNSNWIAENCEVIAFVIDDQSGEVLNVVKKAL